MSATAGCMGMCTGRTLGCAPTRIGGSAGFRALHVGEDVDLVGRLVDAGAPLAWDARNAVCTSDRRACRARGGFGDYARSLAEDGVASAATADSA
jgi:hypothetical protein